MSRFEKDGERFAIAWGVDHVTGTYAQVWLQPKDEQDGALIVIDNQGPRPSGPDAPGVSELLHALYPDRRRAELVILLIESVRARFKQAAESGNRNPNVDHLTVAKLFALFGFEDMERAVFEAFD